MRGKFFLLNLLAHGSAPLYPWKAKIPHCENIIGAKTHSGGGLGSTSMAISSGQPALKNAAQYKSRALYSPDATAVSILATSASRQTSALAKPSSEQVL